MRSHWKMLRGGSSSRSIRSPDAHIVPAMALMEVLVAGALLAAAMLAFLAVLREAHGDLAQARNNAEATAVAMSVLREAQTSWESGPYAGERAGFSWRLSCSVSREASSPRLAVVNCSVSVARAGLSPLVLDRVWAAPRADILRQP